MILLPKERIKKIQSLLCGATDEVWIEISKYIHAESMVAMFTLPCCEPKFHSLKKSSYAKTKKPVAEDNSKVSQSVPTNPLLIKTEITKPKPAKGLPIWKTVPETPVIANTFHEISKHVVVGSNIVIKKPGCLPVEAIVTSKGKNNVSYNLLGSTITYTCPWQCVTAINVNSKKHIEALKKVGLG